MLKGKKIACFVALPHHTRFLWPITSALERHGAKVIFFTTMADFPFEGDLIKKGKTCKMLQSYVKDDTRKKIDSSIGDFFDIWFRRCFEWDGLRHWPFVLMNGMINAGIEEYFCLDEFIKAERPDMFLALHERNRWGKLIGHLSSQYGIPYVTLQEGDYYEDRLSFSAHTEYSTALLLWGRGIEEMLTRHKSSPDKFVLIGNTHLSTIRDKYFQRDKIMETKKELNIPPGKKVVLFLVGVQWGVAQGDMIWEGLLKGLGDDVIKIFKWHPKVTYSGFKKDVEEYFKEKFPTCIVLHTFDPYRLIPVSDYCVTLGKTTLAVEALSFGKPLFSLPGRDNEYDHYAKWGISQALWPPGNYEPLFRTIKDGIPENIQKNVDNFLNNYFYRNNSVAIDRAIEVIDFIFDNKKSGVKDNSRRITCKDFVPGRISYIIPSGDDSEALLATLTSLSQNVKHDDWEVIIVVNNEGIKSLLDGISGDVRIIESEGCSLSALYNKGAASSNGEYLVFLKPGIVYLRDEGLLDVIEKGIAGIPIRKADMTPVCLGIGFNFNFTPYCITDHNDSTSERQIDAVGGGMISMKKAVFEAVRGFDEGIANHLIEPDMCLSAREKGYSISYLPEALGVIYRETFDLPNDLPNDLPQNLDDEWKKRIRFFAKWCGRLPKDDNYIKFAGELLKV